ncbi:MAG: hypothetical protein D6737_14325 [Chloroflexi bacterium]|nr:MAG: hypothetical protein D6737_14325 [Chloroflexota bacterium]
MPTLSLKQYLQKIDSLFESDSHDFREIVEHCRHILKYYPQNIAAYRYLGRALLAGDIDAQSTIHVYRRVLQVLPDDFVAHASLGKLYQQTGDHQRAIWHDERAFEINPRTDDVIRALHRLRRQHLRLATPRMPLTTGGLARQQFANGLYHAAIVTLKMTLAKFPNRVDMRLLLAQALWASGDRIGAAEAATDVLKDLPLCLEANLILARLWIAVGRPSDAAHYLARIEAVAPYTALNLVHGASTPKDIYQLEELTHQPTARQAALPDQRHQLQERSRIDASELADVTTTTEPQALESIADKTPAVEEPRVTDPAVDAPEALPAFDNHEERDEQDWMSAIDTMIDKIMRDRAAIIDVNSSAIDEAISASLADAGVEAATPEAAQPVADVEASAWQDAETTSIDESPDDSFAVGQHSEWMVRTDIEYPARASNIDAVEDEHPVNVPPHTQEALQDDNVGMSAESEQEELDDEALLILELAQAGDTTQPSSEPTITPPFYIEYVHEIFDTDIMNMLAMAQSIGTYTPAFYVVPDEIFDADAINTPAPTLSIETTYVPAFHFQLSDTIPRDEWQKQLDVQDAPDQIAPSMQEAATSKYDWLNDGD